MSGRRLNELSSRKTDQIQLQTVFKIVPADRGPYGTDPDTMCVQRTGAPVSLLNYIADGYRQGTCREAGGFSRLNALRSVWVKRSSY